MKRQIRKLSIICSALIIMICICGFMEGFQMAQAAVKTPAAPTSVKATSSSNSITITWNGVTGAKGYAVYRAASSSGTYSLLSLTSSKSYKDIKLATGKKYYYKIRAYVISGNKKVYGKYSSVVNTIVLPSAPASIKASSSSYNSITLSWNAVSGAGGYAVYRASSSTGVYSLITTTTSKTYVNKSVTTGKTYYYKVRAYITSGTTKKYGTYSSIVKSKAVPAPPSSIKATVSSYNSITINWNGVAGASGYRVYVATSSNGTYSLITDTTKANYVNAGLTTGRTYYYKVRAYRLVGSTKVYGNYTSIVSKTLNLSTPVSVTATAASTDQIGISWDSVAGAEGYELYSALSSSGTYKLISSGSATSYNDYGLSAGTTYYYKIKAYKLIDGNKVYGSFSSTASAMTDKVINVSSLSLNSTSYTLTLGQAYQLIATVAPANAENQTLTWVSSDNSVATVDQNGNVMSVNTGTAIITVITTDGSKSANCTINVINAVDVGNESIKGIDVSKWQGVINWDKVAGSGIQFAMIRSSFGSSSTDPYYETNYTGAKASGIAVGVYHYSYATTVAKAATEVQFLISKLQGKQFEYPICVDIEDSSMSTLSKKALTDIAITYLDALSNAGYYPMIYANKTWFTTKLDDTQLAGYDHWLAQWGSSITYTGEVGIWQYSSSGTVSGISGKVDMDTSFIDYASLIKQLGLNGF